jgi:hypothetical protein
MNWFDDAARRRGGLAGEETKAKGVRRRLIADFRTIRRLIS